MEREHTLTSQSAKVRYHHPHDVLVQQDGPTQPDISAAISPIRYAPPEFLSLERSSETKHELVSGEVFAMAGASPAHNRIVFNLATHVGVALMGGECQGYSSDQRVRVPETDLYTYPDLTIVCGEPEYDPAVEDSLRAVQFPHSGLFCRPSGAFLGGRQVRGLVPPANILPPLRGFRRAPTKTTPRSSLNRRTQRRWTCLKNRKLDSKGRS